MSPDPPRRIRRRTAGSASRDPSRSRLTLRVEPTIRQHEPFELARERDDYARPRGTTAADLATDLDVSKTTVLEHLWKAEDRLLDP